MDLLRQSFRDIARGYTSGLILGKRAYIRHLAYADQIEQDTKRDEFYADAKAKGAPTNEERLKQLKADGSWPDSKEKELADSRSLIRGLIEGKRANSHMPSMVVSMNRQIAEEEKKYTALTNERYRLIGLTCETYAERELTDFYILANLYSDECLTTSLFTSTFIEYMADDTAKQIVTDYNNTLNCCSEQSIKKLVMQMFFRDYFSLIGEDVMPFFGRPICALTFYQVTLLQYALLFRRLYQEHKTTEWSKEVQEDPDLFLDYARSVAEGKKIQQQKGAYDSDALTVGMKPEDAKALGVPNVQNDLATQVAKSGGNLLDFLKKRQG